MSGIEVLIVEDEPKIAQILNDYLVKDGFRVQMLHEGTQAVEIIRTQQPGFVVLDLMLPGKDGISICREVRQFSNVPILMLTARVDEIDRLVGLEMGADDYVCKPFLPREVVARIKTILRRVQPQEQAAEQTGLLHYRGIQLSTERFECRVRDGLLELTPVEFRMLHTLLEQPGRVYSREQLMASAYQDNRVVSDRTIDSHIKNLRKKLTDRMAGDEVIHSIYGVGYKVQ